jgi:outer membrane protein OmpA-like peptidoglycan-associated protein
MISGLALLWLVVASPALADFGSDITLKLGGSGLYNHRLIARQANVGTGMAGIHASLDYTINRGKNAFGFSPYLNVYRRMQEDASTGRPANEAATNVMAGLNFIYTGFSNDRATYYLGIGGGATRIKVVDVVNVPLPTTRYDSKLMATGLMGLEVKIMPMISLFVEPTYVFSRTMLNGLAVHSGLAFHFGKAPRALPERQALMPVYMPPRQEPMAPQVLKPEPITMEPAALMGTAEPMVSSATALATMEERIHFKNDRSDLSAEAKAILDSKVTVFRANPAMRIVISGFASKPGTEAYNMALGLRRAEAAKAYLVSKGVDPVRIEIATHGEGQLMMQGRGEYAAAANRRGEFRLLIADPFLAAPAK